MPSRLLHLARLETFRYYVDDVTNFVHEEITHGLLVAGVVATDQRITRGGKTRDKRVGDTMI